MSPFPPSEPDESPGVTADDELAGGQSVVVHLPGAGDSPADRRLVDMLLELRPGLLFVAGSVS